MPLLWAAGTSLVSFVGGWFVGSDGILKWLLIGAGAFAAYRAYLTFGGVL